MNQLDFNKCTHERISKEIIEFEDGSWISTGDFICDFCGETFSENPNKTKKEV